MLLFQKKNMVMIHVIFCFIHIFLVDINISEIVSFKQKLKLEFKMEDLGPATRILGMKIKRDRVGNKLFLYQQLYISKVLN